MTASIDMADTSLRVAKSTTQGPLRSRRFTATKGLVVAAMFSLVITPLGRAQDALPPVVIPDAQACAACSIIVGSSLKLDVVAAEVDHLPPKVVREDGNGRFWVLSGHQPPKLFDKSGRFIRAAGRTGSGPGEFATPQDVLALPGDSVLVIENGIGQVLSSNLHSSRRINMGRALYPGVILAWPSSVIMAGDVMGPHLGRRRTHQVSLSGSEARVEQQLAVDESVPRSPIPSAGIHKLAPSPSKGGVWSADPFSYRLRLWTPNDGVRRFERRPEWFASTSEFWLGNASTPPPPRIAAIHEDEEGLLWVFVLVASPNWRDAWANQSRVREVSGTSVDLPRLFETVVEVIDFQQARVIARTRIREYVVEALAHRRAVLYTENSAGTPHLTVTQFEFRRP